jgi:hypothetical protein
VMHPSKYHPSEFNQLGDDSCKLVPIPLAPFDRLWRGEDRLSEILAENPEARKALLRTVTDVEMQRLQELQENRAVSFEETVTRLRKIVKATEIEDPTEVVIKVTGGDSKPVEWEMQLQQQLKPEFFRRIRKLFSDEENLKSAAGFAVKSAVEVAKPLAVAGLARALGLDLSS